MWERRKDEPQARPQAAPAPAPVSQPQDTSAAAAPARSASGGPPAAIGRAVTIRGDIYSEQDLVIDGDVEGTIEVKEHTLTIGPNGHARTPMIRARDVVVMGTVQGNIECSQKLTVRREGRLTGDVRTAGIVIDDEAYFKGSIDLIREDRAPGS